MRYAIWFFLILAVLAYGSRADAGSVTQSLPISVKAQPIAANVIGVTADCSWPAGTVVAKYVATGGTGQPITWSMTGDIVNYALSATTGSTTNLIVGPNGIATGTCGTIANVNVTATQ